MKYTELGKTGLMVSEVGFGVLTVGHNQLNLDIDQGAKIITHALEKGINFFDTAEYYQTYSYMKKAFDDFFEEESKDKTFSLQGRPMNRKDMVICSKSLAPTYQGMMEAVENGLKELDIDFFHIFMLHEVRHDGDLKLRTGAIKALMELKAAGKVKAIGISTHHVDVAKEVAAMENIDVLFPLINLESLGIRNGAKQGTKEDMEDAIKANADNGKGVFTMKVFGGGNLVNQYMAAMNYNSSLPKVASMMLGFGATEEVDKAIDFVEGTLDPNFTPDVANKKIKVDQGDCEGCGACILRCTSKALYLNKNGLADVDHSKCLTCGYCAPVCPTRAIIFL